MDDGALFRFPPPSAPAPYRTIALVPVLDWSAWNVQNDPVTEAITAPGSGGDITGGFAKAVEMCNNNGHCRKFDAGTMCPSFRVTRDEQHLTRGRANTLRLALSGQLGADAFTSEAMYETLDLCVVCKGCRRECPTGVDMARMKVEFLAHYKARHGYTLKDRLVARLPDYAPRAQPRAVARRTCATAFPARRWLGEQLLGLSAQAPAADAGAATPSGARATRATSPTPTRRSPRRARGGKAAVLFVDTFNGIFESENALAAARVLHAAGYTLHTLDEGRRPPLLRPHLPGQRHGRRGEARAPAR